MAKRFIAPDSLAGIVLLLAAIAAPAFAQDPFAAARPAATQPDAPLVPTTRTMTQSPTLALVNDFFNGVSSGRRERALQALGELEPMGKADIDRVRDEMWSCYRESPDATLRLAAAAKGFVMSNDEPLHYVSMTTGQRGPQGWAIYLDLHGGGEGAPEMNDGDWRVHQTRYAVPGKLVAIRAPRDTWDQFHNEYFHTFMERVVEQMILAEDADPNRIYLQGFSSGGYGVMQLAPAMPDRFAAAACNAAATEGSRPENLRDLPFIYRVGENDDAYGRDKLAKETGALLDSLQKADPQGYDHWFELVANHGHGFDDRPDDEWMSPRTRDPYPAKIVWWQNQPGRGSSNPIRHQFYWLAVEPDVKRDDSGTKKIVATRDGQTIALAVDGYAKVRVRLNDAMVDLDQPVTVTMNGTTVADKISVPRNARTLLETFLERKDPTYAFPAELTLAVPQPTTRAASDTPTSSPTGIQSEVAAQAKPDVTSTMDCCVVDLSAVRAAPPTTLPAGPLRDALDRADPAYRDALRYSIDTRPAFDAAMDVSVLVNNARLACEAANESPWGSIDPAMFANYVLPYANFDEHRDDWRPQLYAQLREQAWKQKSPLDAAKWINDHFAELFDVTYSATDRPKPDMSPFESFAAKHASCTGLSILLVDACRSVGIPARVVGVPQWTRTEGNHNWVEVWDGQWWSIGDSGTDPRGDDWVKDRARTQTDPDDWQHSVYALSWRETNTFFPVVWNDQQRALPALNVTRFYANRLSYKLDVPGDADATIRVYWAGELIVRKVGHGTVELPLAGGSVFTIKIMFGDGREETREIRT